MLRFFAICCIGLVTCGCAMVTSDKPLFTSGDAGAVALRHGLWTLPDDTCKYDPAQPVTKWPSCANGMVVSSKTMTGGFGKADSPPQTLGYVLAAGDPVVVQLKGPPDAKPTDPAFIYAGLRPVRMDDTGRIVEAHVWLALCFKPPLNANGKLKTPAPFPGLTMKQGDPFCRAADPAAVRNAVIKSEANAIQGDKLWLLARWLRDGEK